MKRSIPVFATILMILSLAILCSLGIWQLQRLQWKENLLADIAAARAAGPQETGFEDIRVERAPLYARLRGQYAKDVFPVSPRTYRGENGFHILAPFVMAGGGVVMVNRGWVPQGQERNIAAPPGTVAVSGLMRLPGRGNPFVPANDPRNNRWFNIDPAQMAAAAGFEHIAPLVMYAESEAPESASLQPVRAALQWSPPDNHGQYAFFWFSMAVVLLIIYYLRFWRRL